MDRNRSHLSPDRARFDHFDLNLRSLNIFVQVAESGSISQSARRMGLTQSAVSQTIANLEQCIGVQLFDRDIRPMALTRSGTILLDKARGVRAFGPRSDSGCARSLRPRLCQSSISALWTQLPVRSASSLFPDLGVRDPVVRPRGAAQSPRQIAFDPRSRYCHFIRSSRRRAQS